MVAGRRRRLTVDVVQRGFGAVFSFAAFIRDDEVRSHFSSTTRFDLSRPGYVPVYMLEFARQGSCHAPGSCFCVDDLFAPDAVCGPGDGEVVYSVSADGGGCSPIGVIETLRWP